MAHNYIQKNANVSFQWKKLSTLIRFPQLIYCCPGKMYIVYMFYKWYLGTFYSFQALTIRKPNEKSFGVKKM